MWQAQFKIPESIIRPHFGFFSHVGLILTLSLSIPLYAKSSLEHQDASAKNGKFEIISEGSNTIKLEWKSDTINSESLNEVDYLAGKQSSFDGGLVRLPWGRTAELIVTGGEITRWDESSGKSEAISLAGCQNVEPWVTLGEAGIFRDLTVAPLQVKYVQKSIDGKLLYANHLEITIAVGENIPGFSTAPPHRPVSRAFYNTYQSQVINELDDLGVRLMDTKGSYLIVVNRTYVTSIQDFIEWKRQKGHNVVLYEFDTTPSFQQLRNTIREYYYSHDPPLEYVLLVGDENRGSEIPSGRITNPSDHNEIDVSDWKYTHIEGDDYFPEFFIGRMTVGTTNEALNASRRVVNYERDPFMVENEYRWTNATLAVGNFAEDYYSPITTFSTIQWLQERLLNDWGFTDVDTLTWRQGSGNNATDRDISNSINAGTNWVAYRGWGNSVGWLAPIYDRTDIDNLTNVNLLPIVVSATCNTGDFGNFNNTKCFAEHWITAGNPNNPTGGIAVIAPTDLHTQTRYNNPLLAGFFYGIYVENIRNISEALQRAKWEIYYGFPNHRAPGGVVEFYWNIYHVFGDPTLDMWVKRPLTMNPEMPDEIPLGQDYLEISLDHRGYFLPQTYVQLRQGDEFLSGGFPDESGVVSLPIDAVEPGDLEVTITCPDYIPVIDTITITQPESYVGVVDWEWNDDNIDGIQRGEEIELTVTLQNTGNSNQYDVSASLTHPDNNLVTIDVSNATFGDISTGSTQSNAVPFNFILSDNVPDGMFLEFELQISSSAGGEWTGKIWIPVEAVNLEYASHEVTEGEYSPGGEASLRISFTNNGSADAREIIARLESWNEAVTVVSDEITLGDILAGETVTPDDLFELSVAEGTYGGRIIHYTVFFSSGDDEIGYTVITLPLEGALSTDPLGPDAYGYFAYDDTDTGFDNMDETVPEYQWWNLGRNNGSLYELSDDQIIYISLPFDFTFYGETYLEGDTITVSSNGWLDFQKTANFYRLFFRNWQIPGVLGPRAMIAPFWDDLKPPTGLDTRVYTYYDEANALFIIEWNSWNRYLLDQMEYPARFALVLKDESEYSTPTGDGIIEFHYFDCENVDTFNNYATVGIQNEMHTIGLEYTYAGIYPDAAAEIEDHRAIRITTIPPDNYDPIPDPALAQKPDRFQLYNNFPNPFNNYTEIRFDLAETAHVELSLFNILGQEPAKLLNSETKWGKHKYTLNAGNLNLSSGVYFLCLKTDKNIAISKMVYLR